MNQKKTSMIIICVMLMLVGQASASGFTIKAMSNIDYSSNTGYLNSANLTLDIISNDGGQTAFGSWNKLGQYNLSYPIEIRISNRKETYIYPIQNQGALFKFDSYYIDRTGFWNGAVCPARPAYCFPITTSDNGLGVDRYLVVKKVESGSYGLFGNGERSSSQDLSVSINGSQYSKKIGSGDNAKGAIQLYDSGGEWIASAQFVGASPTGAGSPNQNNFVATQRGKGWSIAPIVDYKEYQSSLIQSETALQDWQDSQELLNEAQKNNGKIVSDKWPCEDTVCSTVLNQINEHDANYQKLIDENVKIDYGAATSEQKTTTTAGNIIDIVDRSLAYDEIILVIRMDKIGIIATTGKPIIESVVPSKCIDGDSNCNLRVSVRNAGNNIGTFAIRANGTNENKLTLEPGEHGETTLFFINPTQGEYNGNVEVYDINSGESSTRDYNLTVLPPKTLIPNQETINNDVIFKSDETGMKNNEKESCTDGVFEYSNGSYSCKKLNDIRDPAEVKKEKDSILTTKMEEGDPPQKPGGAQGVSLYEWLLLIAIIGGFFLYLIEKVVNRQSRGFKRKNVIGAGTLSVLVLVLIALLLYALLPRIENWGNELFINYINDKIKDMIKL